MVFMLRGSALAMLAAWLAQAGKGNHSDTSREDGQWLVETAGTPAPSILEAKDKTGKLEDHNGMTMVREPVSLPCCGAMDGGYSTIRDKNYTHPQRQECHMEKGKAGDFDKRRVLPDEHDGLCLMQENGPPRRRAIYRKLAWTRSWRSSMRSSGGPAEATPARQGTSSSSCPTCYDEGYEAVCNP